MRMGICDWLRMPLQKAVVVCSVLCIGFLFRQEWTCLRKGTKVCVSRRTGCRHPNRLTLEYNRWSVPLCQRGRKGVSIIQGTTEIPGIQHWPGTRYSEYPTEHDRRFKGSPGILHKHALRLTSFVKESGRYLILNVRLMFQLEGNLIS